VNKSPHKLAALALGIALAAVIAAPAGVLASTRAVPSPAAPSIHPNSRSHVASQPAVRIKPRVSEQGWQQLHARHHARTLRRLLLLGSLLLLLGRRRNLRLAAVCDERDAEAGPGDHNFIRGPPASLPPNGTQLSVFRGPHNFHRAVNGPTQALRSVAALPFLVQGGSATRRRS
jgi:hypothetical protein